MLVRKQVPEFIATDYPKFVEFLKAYYDFMDANYSTRVESLRDVDLTADALVTFLKQEFAHKFPTANINDRKLISIIRRVYQSKGSFKAIELLFRIFFNEAITVSLPNKNILRASDGKWFQYKSVTVRQIYGAIPTGRDLTLKIKSSRGTYFVEVDTYTQVNEFDTRFFFRSFANVIIEAGQDVDILDPDGVTVLYRGKLIKAPAKIKIVNPGKYWKRGQLIRFPGTSVDSLVRVVSVNETGGITAAEIVEFGYDHAEDQGLIISPFPNKPTSANYDITTTITGYSGGSYTYDHVLTINDETNGISESVNGYSDSIDAVAYFTGDWAEPGYYGRQVIFVQSSSELTESGGLVDPNLTVEQWFESRAVLQYSHDYVVTLLGGYVASDSLISELEIRLQDNYFYQLFSYVITTEQQIETYRGIVSSVHPSGMKYFGEFAKTAKFIISGAYETYRTASSGRTYLNDVFDTLDAIVLDVIKALTDTATAEDAIASFGVQRSEDDSVTGDDSLSFAVTRTDDDSVTTSEDFIVSATSLLADAIDAPTDVATFAITNESTDTVSASETFSIDINTGTYDDATVASDTGFASQEILYNTESFFGEDYVLREINVTIG